MSCCHGNRVVLSGGPAGVNPSRQVAGVHGYISHYGEEPSTIANTSPAWGEALGFGKAVGAGVAIWAVTRVLDRMFSRRR